MTIGKHMPKCNERCTEDSHYLQSAELPFNLRATVLRASDGNMGPRFEECLAEIERSRDEQTRSAYYKGRDYGKRSERDKREKMIEGILERSRYWKAAAMAAEAELRALRGKVDGPRRGNGGTADAAVLGAADESHSGSSPDSRTTCDNDSENCAYSRTDCALDNSFNCQTHATSQSEDAQCPDCGKNAIEFDPGDPDVGVPTSLRCRACGEHFTAVKPTQQALGPQTPMEAIMDFGDEQRAIEFLRERGYTVTHG